VPPLHRGKSEGSKDKARRIGKVVGRCARKGRRAKSFSTRSSRNSARQHPEHASSSSSLSDMLHVLHAAATRGGRVEMHSSLAAFGAGIARASHTKPN